MSEPVNTDLTSQMLSLLLPQFDNSPIIRGIVKTVADGLQEIRNDIFAVHVAFDVYTAEGQQLEYIVGLFGLERKNNETDGELRTRYFREVANQKADGTIGKIHEITVAATGHSVRVVESFPNTVVILIEGTTNLDTVNSDFLKSIAPSGTETVAVSLDTENTVWFPCEEDFQTDAAVLPEEGDEDGIVMAEEISRYGT